MWDSEVIIMKNFIKIYFDCLKMLIFSHLLSCKLKIN